MQGRFKRDGSAAAEPEPRGATDRGPSAEGQAGEGSADRPQATSKAKAKANKAKLPSGPGSRIALRNWRISTRLVSLLALPVVAATTLGGLRINDALTNVDQLDHMKLLTDMTGKATQLANALQEERDRSAGPKTDGNPGDDAVVASQEKTNQAIDAFNGATSGVKPTDPTMVGVQTTLVDITRQLNKIKQVRQDSFDPKQSDYIARSVNNYDGLINALLSLSQDMAQATSNADMITSTRALATFSAAKEYASIQRAVISAALANKKGPYLSPNDQQYGREAYDAENEAVRRFIAIRGADSQQLLQAINGGNADITTAKTYTDRVFSKDNGIKNEPKSYKDWYDQASVKLGEMSKIEQTLLSQMEQKALELRDDAQQDAIINGVLIILVLGISLVGAFVVARSMVRSLRRLQDTAQRVAQDRLPELVKQLSETDPQDVDTSVESVGVHSLDEIGKVAAAFDDVHREAVRLAAEQALLRGNVNAMFTNLSRRSQGLIQRQLSLISELESREADPDQLSSLFKLDHLATRMRRNGENLLVLAGEEPGRRWTRPVPLVDVLRAAASEVEQYERIELSGVPPTEVAGRVVNDLVHLLAELLENATSFSSPQTKVKVTGHALPDGRVLVEIHDTGIGLSQEDLASINERLASPPTVDVSVSRRMGLFVVGRLSLRHGIRIQLRPSDSGGTTALVMLPVDVAQGGKKPMPGAVPPAAANGLPGGNSGAAGSAPRRQVPPAAGQQRPALPPRQGAPDGGLPARPAPAPGGGATPSAGSLFDASPRGGADRTPPQGAGGRPALPTRGNGGPAAVPPPPPPPPQAGQSGRRKQQPAQPNQQGQPGQSGQPGRGNGAGELPARQAPSWGSEQSAGAPKAPQAPTPPAAPVDDWPVAGNASSRSAQDTPRGHEDVESTGQFPGPQATPRAALPSAGPGDTAEFPAIGAGPDASGSTGRFERPRPVDAPNSTSGQFARPVQGDAPSSTSGQYDRPALGEAPNSTSGQFARPVQGDTPNSTSGQYDRPALGEAPNSTSGQFARPVQGDTPNSTSGQHAQPEADDDPLTSTTGQFARPALREAGHSSPLFEELESNWFRGAAGEEQAAAPEQAAQAPSSDGLPKRQPRQSLQDPERGPLGDTPRAPQASRPTRPSQARPVPQTRQAPQAQQPAADNWRQSPNDERWRRAEQVREPASGGTTSSGLPRRVPRANLVDGTAETQAVPQVGPQVSRAPDDVRGRLTNLRRGIQQGRQAGNTSSTGNHTVDPTYQQER
ncbi:nitrate- and nitrite sensing domain-containing protein [Streptomyces roseoverticillatus]|uniref:sensor histidine kinase n=1 Tax=Streptomyces roseoverticillatus TaxID=66429 RepID=UPI001F1EA3DB|nr:nitrate- and nitrite sensing domain-containing protein [Streptomyces roseoverticillatus]MCF3105807.1 nitrate- and nitrite sensing domain-containing protein [Streptomyces roseoverticillatus]